MRSSERVRGAIGCIAALVVAATSGIGDPRSSGQGPGLVGDPLTAVLVVAGIAVVTVGITLAYVRLTARREDVRRS